MLTSFVDTNVTEVNAVGNATDKIIVVRENVLDASGKIVGSDNVAYSWNVDPAKRVKLKWDLETARWLEIDSSGNFVSNNGKKHVWKLNFVSNSFELLWE